MSNTMSSAEMTVSAGTSKSTMTTFPFESSTVSHTWGLNTTTDGNNTSTSARNPLVFSTVEPTMTSTQDSAGTTESENDGEL